MSEKVQKQFVVVAAVVVVVVVVEAVLLPQTPQHPVKQS